MKPLEELYAQLPPVAGAAPGTLPPPGDRRETGHFNVFNVADLMPGYRSRPPMAFDRRAFYKISLIRGRSRIEYADQVVEVEDRALWFASHRVPYRWLPHDLAQTGYFCIFTDGFLRPGQGGVALDELPVFGPGGCPVLPVSEAEYAAIENIFSRMQQEITSGYAHKYDLLHAYLVELVHCGQKLQPAPALTLAPTAATRLAARFADLLERQFPLENPQQRLRLRTARAYADGLAVHVNHLNRVLKETTGRTTTALLSGRVAQEARLLLRQTSWTVSEVADSLGFADVAHFSHFFKRQTGLAPSDFRSEEIV